MQQALIDEQCLELIDKLIAKVKPVSSTKIKSAIVALFTATDQQPLTFSGQIGILHLDIDRAYKNHFLRFYEPNSLILLFEVQLFYGFSQNYRKTKQNLYIFDYLSEGIIGYLFCNNDDATKMEQKIKYLSPKFQDFRNLKKQQIKLSEKKKKKSSYISRFTKSLHNLFVNQQQEESETQIIHQTEILNVSKIQSIHFNFETNTFQFENLSKEWEQIFAEIEMSKSDLKDKYIAKIFMEEALKYSPHQLNQSTIESSIKKQNNLKQELLRTIDVDRSNLLQEIRVNNLKLRPVKTTQKGYQLDISCMNSQQKKDFTTKLRQKLKKRKQALKRRKDVSDDEENI